MKVPDTVSGIEKRLIKKFKDKQYWQQLWGELWYMKLVFVVGWAMVCGILVPQPEIEPKPSEAALTGPASELESHLTAVPGASATAEQGEMCVLENADRIPGSGMRQWVAAHQGSSCAFTFKLNKIWLFCLVLKNDSRSPFPLFFTTILSFSFSLGSILAYDHNCSSSNKALKGW